MKLYHYTSGEGLKGIIEEKKIQCTNVSFLNDPTENKYHFDVLQSVLEANERCRAIYKTFHDDVFDRCFYDSDHLFILSFSDSSDSLAMWTLYGKGKGYCIRFDWDKICQRNKDRNFQMTPLRVIYDKEEQKRAMCELILSFEEKLLEVESICKDVNYELKKNIRIFELGQEFNFALLDNSYKYKQKCFDCENEFRIGIEINDHTNLKELIGYKTSPKGTIVKYLTLDIDPREDIVSILLHPLSSDIDLKELESLIEQNEMNNCEIENSVIPFREI